jgi:hypothetical protein
MERAAFGADFGKAGGNDDEGADSLGGAVVHHREDRARRNRDDGQVDRFLDGSHGWEDAPPGELRGIGVDRVHRTPEAR